VSGARANHRIPNWGVGLIMVVLVLFGFYLAFTKKLPFTGNGYEVKAVFRDAQNIALNSPVREAGVNVGEVTGVDPLPKSNAAVITMSIKDQGRPLHDDARLQLRPRLFLEGNLFVDVHPGSPSAPELRSGDEIPIQQTSNSVQLDQILTSLQANVRGNLQLALREVGNAFEKHGGAKGLRDIFAKGGPAYKNTAWVNEALLGTRAHDLSGLIRNFDIVASALDRNEPQLKSLVTNLRIVTGSFAAQDQALQASIHELPGTLFAARPVFANLNRSFPFVRAFAREALPGVRSSGPTLTVATPFIYQLRKLVSKPELRGLTHDLRPTVPQLARLARAQMPFMEQARALSSCFNHVIIPWSNETVPASDSDTDKNSGDIGKIYQETGYGLAGIAGESRSGDANGQYIRVEAGGGVNTLSPIASPTMRRITQTIGGEQFFGVLDSEILGAEPAFGSSAKTPFKPTVPCETQAMPDLRSGGPESVPGQTRVDGGASPANSQVADLSRKYAQVYMDSLRASQMQSTGNFRRGNSLSTDVAKQFLNYDQKDMPLYEKAIHALTGLSTGRAK
jgi:phospholipid/cholesterol/gamma-HCH transport system substrate-binding protein